MKLTQQLIDLLEKAKSICEIAYRDFEFREYYFAESFEDEEDDLSKSEKRFRELQKKFFDAYQFEHVCHVCVDGIDEEAEKMGYDRNYDHVFPGNRIPDWSAVYNANFRYCIICYHPVCEVLSYPDLEKDNILIRTKYLMENIKDQYNLAHAYLYFTNFKDRFNKDGECEERFLPVIEMAKTIIEKAEEAGFDGSKFEKYVHTEADYKSVIRSVLKTKNL